MKKTSSFLSVLLAVGLCSFLCACSAIELPSQSKETMQNTQQTETAVPTESDIPTETATPTEKEPVASEETNPENPIKEPVDIETIGGAVIVGKIGFDEAGWHIVPEQPLNITYEYFLNNPSVFPEQTIIHLIAPMDDGSDKAVYLGHTVTVQGEFRFVRNDFETLYLLPHTITTGKIVEESYGDSELKAPEGPVDLYDRSEPLPKYLDPMIWDGSYIYNAFMLSEETLMLMGNDFASFYCDFVDAILGYRSEVPCPEKRYAELLSSVIYYDFPLFNACAEPFEFLKHYDSESNTIHIEYLYSEEEHRKLLAEFLKAVDELLSGVTPDMSDVEKAKNIYHAICIRMVYDDSALEDLERKDSYFAYLYNSGVCITFANVYNQLLTQVGIKATLATCEYDATMGHVWSVVTLNDKDYFCDPTFELSHDNGNGYIYFGMNYADRTRDGIGKDGIRVGKYYFTSTVLPEMIAEQSVNK